MNIMSYKHGNLEEFSLCNVLWWPGADSKQRRKDFQTWLPSRRCHRRPSVGIAVEDRQRTIHRPAARRAERTANRCKNAVSTNQNCAMGRLLLILDAAIIGPVEFLSSATKFFDAWSPIIRTTRMTPADIEFAAANMRDADNWLVCLRGRVLVSTLNGRHGASALSASKSNS